jgi:hypothetical protein
METNQQNQLIDVTQPPFNARGDGKTDDAFAVQRAVDFAHEQFGPLSRDEQLRIPQDDAGTCPT